MTSEEREQRIIDHYLAELDREDTRLVNMLPVKHCSRCGVELGPKERTYCKPHRAEYMRERRKPTPREVG